MTRSNFRCKVKVDGVRQDALMMMIAHKMSHLGLHTIQSVLSRTNREILIVLSLVMTTWIVAVVQLAVGVSMSASME